MKCPKCGYNSFEFHDSCKKCANDLTGYKETYGLKSIVLPVEARTNMAEALMAQSALSDPAPDTATAPVDMFSFDVPGDGAPSTTGDDPFNFDDETVSPVQAAGDFSFDDGDKSAQAKAEEDAFADLLESTSQKEESAAAPAAAESNLNDFSWDDTPAEVSDSGAKAVEDDFNSLFGETDEPAKP